MLIDIDLDGVISESVVIEEEDGSTATVSLSKVYTLPEPGSISTMSNATIANTSYRFRYNNTSRGEAYSYVTHINNNIDISRLSELEYNFKYANVRSTSMRRIDRSNGIVQLNLNNIPNSLGGTSSRTETARSVIAFRRNGGSLEIRRNGSSSFTRRWIANP